MRRPIDPITRLFLTVTAFAASVQLALFVAELTWQLQLWLT